MGWPGNIFQGCRLCSQHLPSGPEGSAVAVNVRAPLPSPGPSQLSDSSSRRKPKATSARPTTMLSMSVQPYQTIRFAAKVSPVILGADMRRREFLGVLGSAAAWPMAGRAQTPGRSYRIGYLTGASRRQATLLVALLDELRLAGFIERHNLTVLDGGFGVMNNEAPAAIAALVSRRLSRLPPTRSSPRVLCWQRPHRQRQRRFRLLQCQKTWSRKVWCRHSRVRTAIPRALA